MPKTPSQVTRNARRAVTALRGGQGVGVTMGDIKPLAAVILDLCEAVEGHAADVRRLERPA